MRATCRGHDDPLHPVNEERSLAAAISRHAGLVYSTARRVLGSDAHAADVVQETFFQFARNTHRIRGSIAGWLHRVATRRSLDLIRQESSRRLREREYAALTFDTAQAWSELEPVLDQALEQLPDGPRELLILHFLEGRTTTQIAAKHGWSQPTASRRIQAALILLREKLREHGVALSLALLAPLLGQSAQAAPADVLVRLGKISLAQSASGSLAGFTMSASAVGSSWFAKVAAIAIAIATVMIVTGTTRFRSGSGSDSALSPPSLPSPRPVRPISPSPIVAAPAGVARFKPEPGSRRPLTVPLDRSPVAVPFVPEAENVGGTVPPIGIPRSAPFAAGARFIQGPALSALPIPPLGFVHVGAGSPTGRFSVTTGAVMSSGGGMSAWGTASFAPPPNGLHEPWPAAFHPHRPGREGRPSQR